MANCNNNETYKLLELSDHSDSDLDLPELITTPRKKKLRRKYRKSRPSSAEHVQPTCLCNARIVSVWIVALLLTIWIITLTWLAIMLHNEIQRLDSAVARVAASSQAVPVQLQELHTKSKSLQQNQSIIFTRIDSLKLQLENFTKDVSDVQATLNKIQDKLHSIPDHVNVPQQLQDVSASIANLGSQIKDITTTVAVLKNAKEQLESNNNILVQNVTNLRQSVMILQNTTQVPIAINSENDAEIQKIIKEIDGIKDNITIINSTLSNNIIWVKEDLKKNNKNIESMSNVGQNMSARVTTLEGICGKTTSDQITMSKNLKSLTDEFQSVSLNIQNHSSQISELQSQIYQLNQNSSELASAVNTMNQYIDNNKSFTQTQDISREFSDSSKTKADIPSSTVQQETVTPAQTSGNTTKERNPTGKPAILSIDQVDQ